MQSKLLKGFPSVPGWRSLFFYKKDTGFPIYSGHKTEAAIVLDCERDSFVAEGGEMRIRHYNDNGGSGGDQRRKTS